MEILGRTVSLSIRKPKPKPDRHPGKVPPPALVLTQPEPEWVGWRIATFAADRLTPAPGLMTSSVIVWRAYLDWCRDHKRVPLAMAVFVKRFDALAEEVGIPRFQNGAHVLYRDLDVRRD